MTTWDISKPRPEAFPDDVDPIARAGYAVHSAHKPRPRSWDVLTDLERFRWRNAAAEMVASNLQTPQQVRAEYLAGYADMPWEDAKPGVRKRWEAICAAMWRARHDQLAEETRKQALRDRVAERIASAAADAKDDETAKQQVISKQEGSRREPSQPVADQRISAPATPANARQIATLRERLIEKRRQERKGLPT